MIALKTEMGDIVVQTELKDGPYCFSVRLGGPRRSPWREPSFAEAAD
jgi:hypothetical protein